MENTKNHGSVSVTIKAATKNYGIFCALDNVSLDVAPGEFVSILGPSGSGKTTLLGLLGGFVQPTSGSIHLGDRDITFEPPHRRDIGIVFQNYALFPHMNVAENITFPLRARRIPKDQWHRKLQEVLAIVELTGKEHRGISELSGGQRQRVALARAMIFEPRLILMDEPLSALDKQLRETMQIELKRLHRRLNATVIYVTHDQREALTMSDRIAIMRNGRIVQVGTPTTVHDRPADSFVASFIGEATLVPVKKVSDNSVAIGQIVLRSAYPIPAGEKLFLAVQAEKLQIAHSGASADLKILEGVVTENLYQGESTRVFLDLPDGQKLSLRVWNNSEGRGLLREPGQNLKISLHPEDTVVVPEHI
jgi:putative spermidine/putrescine transport system ATP-binding protein